MLASVIFIIGTLTAQAAGENCVPSTEPFPRVDLLSPGPESIVSREAVAVVLRGAKAQRISDWPWSRIQSIEIVPQSGSAFESQAPRFATAADRIRYGISDDESTSIAVFPIGTLPPNTNYRILVGAPYAWYAIVVSGHSSSNSNWNIHNRLIFSVLEFVSSRLTASGCVSKRFYETGQRVDHAV